MLAFAVGGRRHERTERAHPIEDRSPGHITRSADMVTVNVVVLAGTVAAEPVERQLPSGDEVTELRISVPETGKRLLPLPVAVWHGSIERAAVADIAKGDDVLVYGQLTRRFYRSGAGARSLTEVVATGIKKLEPADPP
jgi:single-strand DNA-binding protein